MWETWVWSLGWEDSPGGGHANPLQYSCLENSHRQRSLVGYNPWGRKEEGNTEWLTFSLSFTFLLQRSHQACLGRDSSAVLRNQSAEMGMIIQMCIHTSLIHLPPHAGTDSQTYSVITGTDNIDVLMTCFHLQEVPYVRTFKLWTTKGANLCLHVQLRKLVQVSSVCCHTAASSASVVLFCTFLYSTIYKTVVAV